MRGVMEALLVSMLATGAATADSSEARQERGKWRVSVGASVVGPVKSDIGVSGARMQRLSGFGTSLMQSAAARKGGRSRAEAYADGSGAADGVRRFDDGAWYDPHDSASANDPDWSWNWRLHDPSGTDPDGRKGFAERTAYHEEYEAVDVSTSDGEGFSSDGSEWFPGLRVELARELYRSDGERPWGVDIAAAFAYYFQRGLWTANGTAATTWRLPGGLSTAASNREPWASACRSGMRFRNGNPHSGSHTGMESAQNASGKAARHGAALFAIIYGNGERGVTASVEQQET